MLFDPDKKAQKLLLKIISKGLIKGNFDRTTGEFYTLDSKVQKIMYKFCPSCGAPLNKVFLEGETIKCDSCGSISI